MRVRQQSHRKLEQVPSAIIPMLPPGQQSPGCKLLLPYCMMLWGLGMVLALCVFQGCGLFQNISKRSTKGAASLRTNADLTQVGSASSDKISSEFLIRNDSVNMVYTIQFWPKGRFSFSPEKGFEGEAERILMNAYVNKWSQNVKRNHVRANAASQWNNIEHQHQEQKSVQKVTEMKKSLSWKWMITGLFLLILFLAYLYRGLFKKLFFLF